jgi:DMSO/TMAO reductase YedYZ heme-binding membrane subunit
MRRTSGPTGWNVAAVLGVTIPTGFLVTYYSLPITQNRYFPWIVGRALGLAAYVALVALVILGVWLRHPWRQRWPLFHPEARLRLHAALGASTCLLVGGHVVALASDRYAGVPWPGTLVPGASTYRPFAVALGIVALYFLVAITATAALGGRLVGKHWLPVHRMATPMVGLVWFHGVLAGSDTVRLRLFYAVTGVVLALVMVSRVLARDPTSSARDVSAPAPIPVDAAAVSGTRARSS